MPKRLFWALYWALFIVLASLCAWFIGNLAYTVLWTALGTMGFSITEAQMATYIAGHLLPFILILVVGTILSLLIRNQLATTSAAAVDSFRKQELKAQERHAEERADTQKLWSVSTILQNLRLSRALGSVFSREAELIWD